MCRTVLSEAEEEAQHRKKSKNCEEWFARNSDIVHRSMNTQPKNNEKKMKNNNGFTYDLETVA